MKRWIAVAAVMLTILGIGSYVAYRNLRQNPAFRMVVRMIVHHSPSLSDKEASDDEKILTRDPEDLATRADLIEYYFERSVSSTDGSQFEEKREQHVLWMIAHHPGSEYVGTPFVWIAPDQPRYSETKALWLQEVASYRDNIRVLSNAAAGLSAEPQTSRGLANRGLALSPKNAKLHEVLAQSYTREMRSADSVLQRRSSAKSALEAWEAYQAVERDEGKQRQHKLDLANTAYEAGDLGRAKQYALELLAHPQLQAVTNEPDADDVHIANTVLGRIALGEGDVEEAKRRLHASASTKGSPVLDSYGPRMSLASELLDHGEKDAVLGYLQQCGAFWSYGADLLKEWQSAIRSGKKPNFGANARP